MSVKKGRFFVVDGLDVVGKGVIIKTWIEEALQRGKRVFDVHDFWKEHGHHPSPQEIIGSYDVIVTSEPTFVGVGRVIREELIAKKGRDYHPLAIAEAYALDRRILYQQLLLPVLEAGVDVYQSRSFSASMVYQWQAALDQGLDCKIDDILALPGNVFCAQHPMSHLVILTIDDVHELMRRRAEREKQDNCAFENESFQLRLKPHYEGEDFRTFFKRLGVPVTYFYAGVSVEFSQQQARDFFHQHLE